MKRDPHTKLASSDGSPPRLSRTEAKRQFKKLLGWTFVISIVTLLIAFVWLNAQGTDMRWPFMLAVAVGIIFSLMMAAALMGLLFFSSASGADERGGPEDLP